MFGPSLIGGGIIPSLAYLKTVEGLMLNFLATSFLLKNIDFITMTPTEVKFKFLETSSLDLLIYFEA